MILFKILLLIPLSLGGVASPVESVFALENRSGVSNFSQIGSGEDGHLHRHSKRMNVQCSGSAYTATGAAFQQAQSMVSC